MKVVTVDGKKCCGCRGDIDGAVWEDEDGWLWCNTCHVQMEDELTLSVEYVAPPSPRPKVSLPRVCGNAVEAHALARAVGADAAYYVGRSLTLDGWTAEEVAAELPTLAGFDCNVDDARAMADIAAALSTIQPDPRA